MKKFWKIIAFTSLAFLIVLIFFILVGFILVKDTKLDYQKFVSNNQTVEVYSNNGNLVDVKTYAKSSEFVNLNSLKDYTKNAFIAIEDKRFYKHNGVDFIRILGATINNVKSLSFKEGASTITQQLIKNTHLTSEKTIKRKLQEIKLAFELENNYSKDEILELYLNTIYFGKGAYGIEKASKTYFNKCASELTINESAMLSAIIKAPSAYSPIDNYKNAKERKDLVLKLMKNYGYISEKEFNQNYNKDVSVKFTNQKNGLNDYINAVYSEYERSEQFIPYSKEKIKIYTYLDERLQNELSQITVDNYNCYKIVINSKINGVIAYNGDYSNLSRSPASCVKPWLVYAPMIDSKFIKESSVINDKEQSFGDYTPKNYGGKHYGKVTVKTAIKDSLNVPAVKLLSEFGIDNANKYVMKMGVDVSNDGLACALGSISGGLTLKQLCDKYSVFNSAGNYFESSFINKIYLGNVKIYQHYAKGEKVFSEETAYIISDALKNAVENGTSKKLRNLPYTVYAKTGTNGTANGNVDALSVSYTTEHVVGVWIGNYDNAVMPNSVTGGTLPTNVSRLAFEKIYQNYKPLPIEKPSGVIEAQIDLEQLINNEKELISKNGETFFYIKGSEPTEEIKKLKPEILDAKIFITNGVANLNFTCYNADKIKIERIFNNDKKVIYEGNVIDKITDNLVDFGNYHYKITLFYLNDFIVYEFPTVKFSKNNLKIIENDNWLYD